MRTKLTSLMLAVIIIVGSLTLCVSAEDVCLHETKQGIVRNDSGLTICDLCTICGEIVTETGYVKNDGIIMLYKDAARTSAYTQAELEAGFENSAGVALYTPAGLLLTTGTPYWLSFDVKVNSLPTLEDGHAQADLDDTNSRAYKGCSLICTVPGGSYFSQLRVIYDGWEADSGASGTTRGTLDGKVPVNLYADSSGFRDANTVVTLKKGDNIHFDMRLDPSTGAYDVYVGGLYVASGKTGTTANDTSSHIRLWEGDGKGHGGDFDFTNIEVFYDNYTKVEHYHSYTEHIEFYDKGLCRYESCNCGLRNKLDCEQITSVVADGLANIYDGLGEFTVNSDDYWFVTDMNLRGDIEDGSLIKVGGTVILDARDGKLFSGDKAVGMIKYPTTYQIAVRVENRAYQLYVNGKALVSGEVDSASTIVCGSAQFGHQVRFLYNKAVTLGETNTPAVPSYNAGNGVKLCCHSDSGAKASEKLLAHTEIGVKYIYNCTLCGERVYSMLKKDITNPANDIAYKQSKNALMKAELESFTADTPRYLYVENNVISNTASPYWLTFDVTPNTIPSNETGNLGDPNSRVYKGYALVSTEPAFLPLSELRVIPDGWEEGNANGTKKGIADGRAEVKVIKPSTESHIGMDTINYRYAETVAYLEVGKTTSFALRIDPKTGVYDVYVDGFYKASSVKESYTDMTPKIAFHDNGAGEYTYSDVRLCQEAYDFGNKIIAIEASVTFAADEASSQNAYTALVAIEQNGEKYNLFYANNKNGTLEFKDKDGNFNTLCDNEGNIVYLDKAQAVTAVYDGINGDVRYYVGGKLARYNDGKELVWANEIAVYDSDFVNSDNRYCSIRFDAAKVTNLNITGLGATDTAEIVGFQSHEIGNSIRLLAGLDGAYYGAVGYEVKAYKADGSEYKNGSVVKTSDTLYESIMADGIVIPAQKYGYSYFAALAIEGDFLGYKDSYIIVKPFTKIVGKTYYGEELRINILDNGRYEFADGQ